MTIAKKHKIIDLIDDINKVNAMIDLHSSDNSAMMLEQYQFKKDKLISYLIDALVDPKVRSPKGMFLIKTAIEKFYPNLTKEASSASDNRALSEIEAVLV